MNLIPGDTQRAIRPIENRIPISFCMGKSKSAKKRRQAAKRREELERLRGTSVLDNASSSPGTKARLFENSPDPTNAAHLKRKSSGAGTHHRTTKNDEDGHVDKKSSSAQTKRENDRSSLEKVGKNRKRIDFVLPRAMGNRENFMFNHGRLNEDLPAIMEEEGSESGSPPKKKKNESIEDILYSNKKKKRKSHREEGEGSMSKGQHEKKEKQKQKSHDDHHPSPKERDESPIGEPAAKKSKKKKTKKELEPHRQDVKLDTADSKRTNGISDTKSKPKKSLDERDRISSEPKTNGKKKTQKSKRERSGSTDSTLSHSEERRGYLSGSSVEEAVRDKVGLRPRANSTDGELNLPQRGLCDERLVLEAHKWNIDVSYVRRVPPKGFHNLGNTCFLNATLQCLAYLPPFCQSLIRMSELKYNKHNGQKMSQGQKITSILCNLFQNVHGLTSQVNLKTAIAPNSIVRAVPSLGSCGSRNGYKFRPGRQEDAHEFLVHLLDAMNDGELRSAGINQHASGWRDRLPVPRLDETTFIHRIFGGYLRSQVRCSKCGYCSNTYDPFLDLSLEVSKKSLNSMLAAFAEFTRKETLDSDNRWRCSGCKKDVRATKQLTVFRPPLSLCVQLKRFTYGGGLGFQGFSAYGSGSWKYGKNSFGGGGSKITKSIEFPPEMNLPLSDGRSCPYELTGVVIHLGNTATSGHYTAYVKRPGRKGTNEWYHMDDSFVDPVSERKVLKQKDAYLLFYCRREVKLEFPKPPPRSSMSPQEAMELGKARARAKVDGNSSEKKTKDSSVLKSQRVAKPDHAEVEKKQKPKSKVEMIKTKSHPLADPRSSSSESESESSSDDESSPSQERPRGLSKDAQNSRNDSESSDSSNESSDSEDQPQPRQERQTEVRRTPEKSTSSSSSDESYVEKADEEPRGGQDQEEQSISSDSTQSSSSDSDSSSSDASSAARSLDKVFAEQESPTKSEPTKRKAGKSTRVVMDLGTARGKIAVMMGPRKNKRMWKPKTFQPGKKEKGSELLGNVGTSTWDDPDDVGKKSKSLANRDRIVEQMEKKEKSKKRKLHLDRWDAFLDQGKVRTTFVAVQASVVLCSVGEYHII